MADIKVDELKENIILVGIDYIGGGEIDQELLSLISKYTPDTVALALCEKRFETMEEKEEWDEKPLLPHYKEGKAGTLIYQAFVDAVRENMRLFRGVDPEMHVARLVPLTQQLDLDIEFIDRDVTVTLSRAFRDMSPVEKLKMIWYFKSAMLSFSHKKKSESVRAMEKHDDLVDGVFFGISKFAPSAARRASEERIEYMSKKIHELSKKGKVLAIVPESKLKDVERGVRRSEEGEKEGEPAGYEHLEVVGRKIYSKILRFASPVFIISLAVYLFFFSDVLNIWRAWLYWYVAVGGMAAVGALLGRGHPISILTSFLLAPFMSLTLIGPGWIAGYIELKVREPQISDVRDITSCSSANEFLSNNVIKVLMVGTFSNVFTWIGLFFVLPLLISIFG